MMLASRRQLLRLLLVVSLICELSGCAVLREFRPAVAVKPMTAGEYIALQRGDILTTGELSAATTQSILMAGRQTTCATPSPACIQAIAAEAGLDEERRLSALAELWLQAAFVRAGSVNGDGAEDAQMQAWMEAARHAYAYLFHTPRQPYERAFEDRQTQVRDWYNHSVQQATTALFRALEGQGGIVPGRRPGVVTLTHAGWTWRINLDGIRLPSDIALPEELLPASSLSFEGLRTVWRRDGFGAELVAVIGNDPSAAIENESASSAVEMPSALALKPWSEMPSPGLTVLFHFAADDPGVLPEPRHVDITAHDPYRQDRVVLHGQQVPLAANFTAGYGLWLARSGFNRQSLRTLFGREDGIARPHLYMLQPWDPERKIILLLHGLASSPEAWVDLANELQGDEDLRRHYQVWLAYYPTNMPIALNHARLRELITTTLDHLDPQREAAASQDLVLIGHSMGGVIARLMVSSADQELWGWATAISDVEFERLEQLRARLDPALRFAPFECVGRAIFIAAPHRGTVAAQGRLGRFAARLIRMPLTLLEGFGDILQGMSPEQARQHLSMLPNSIDNLREDDPFVRAAAALQIAETIPYHSIIGQRDPAIALDASDDGLVPYRSAHLPGAQSELIVHSDHSVQRTPEAILEIRRILHEALRVSAANRTNTSAVCNPKSQRPSHALPDFDADHESGQSDGAIGAFNDGAVGGEG